MREEGVYSSSRLTSSMASGGVRVRNTYINTNWSLECIMWFIQRGTMVLDSTFPWIECIPLVSIGRQLWKNSLVHCVWLSMVNAVHHTSYWKWTPLPSPPQITAPLGPGIPEIRSPLLKNQDTVVTAKALSLSLLTNSSASSGVSVPEYPTLQLPWLWCALPSPWKFQPVQWKPTRWLP